MNFYDNLDNGYFFVRNSYNWAIYLVKLIANKLVLAYLLSRGKYLEFKFKRACSDHNMKLKDNKLGEDPVTDAEYDDLINGLDDL